MRIASSIARALLTSKPAHLLFFSSAAVYGEETENLSISEQTCVEPISWYGIAKFASERLLAKAAREVSVPMASLRPPLVYGPGDTTNSYGPAAFCRAAANGDEVVLWGDGSELREFLYVEDCCRIAAELVLTRFEGVLNPVCGTSCSFRQVLDGVHRIAGSPLQVEEKPRSKPKVNVGFDARRFRDTLPNFRFTSLRDGLLETFSAYAAAR
jgi:UDP-glucose 4-epimerase